MTLTTDTGNIIWRQVAGEGSDEKYARWTSINYTSDGHLAYGSGTPRYSIQRFEYHDAMHTGSHKVRRKGYRTYYRGFRIGMPYGTDIFDTLQEAQNCADLHNL